MKYKYLTQPGQIGRLKLKNRMIMPAMCSYTANDNGSVSEATVNHYARRAAGGIGLIIVEMTNPSPGCQVFPGNLDLSSDAFKPGFARLAKAIHAEGAKCCVQLTHGGVFIRDAAKAAQTPSGIGTFSLPEEQAHTMSKEEIKQVVDDFGRCAFRAKIAGFDGVEIHAAHGYLVGEFLSAFYNHRTDEYGGSLENRVRFSEEIIRSIRRYCGNDFPILYKLPTEDYTPGGITLDQSIRIAQYVEAAGADGIVCTGGTLESRYAEYMEVMNGEREITLDSELTRGVSAACWIPSTYCRPRALYLDNAIEIKKHISIPVSAICGIRPDQADELIRDKQVDFAAFGRQSLADPDFPIKVQEGRIEDMRQCLRCNECIGSAARDINLSCAVNPCLGIEYTQMGTIKKTVRRKRIAVIGGGPAGMQAALAASEAGHHVTLYERNSYLGGLMHYVGIPEFKEDYRRYTDYMIRMIDAAPDIDVRLDTEFTIETAEQEQYDKIIAATGSEVFVPSIPGADQALNPLDVLDGKIPEVKKFIVCGAGLVGCEVSMHLAEQGYDVTMIDIVPDSHPSKMYATDWSINAKLAADGVKVRLGNKIVRMGDRTVECRERIEKVPHDPKNSLLPQDISGPYNEETTVYEADAVICALGLKPVDQLAYALLEKGFPVEIVGDAYKPRKIINAVHEGFHAGRRV